MRRIIRVACVSVVFLILPAVVLSAESRRLSRDELLDRLRGGWSGQMIGNIQGLPFEFKYKEEPGPLPDFTPNLPRCRSDDDTDIEWLHLHAIDRLGMIEVPYPALAREWVRSVNRAVWVSNEQARKLMGQGVLPPWTSNFALNPHAQYNLSGQFCAELYGFLAPGLPNAAARVGRHYLMITVRDEPIQACAYWTSMISMAFFENDLERLATECLAAVDPKSQHAEMVRDVLAWRRESPDDWRAVRAKIQKKYRDERGWNMNATVTNGALVLTALLYGQKDFVETMRLAFALGYDADCNAATCGAILGVIHGAKAMEGHPGWVLPARYDNGTRDGLPKTQSMDDLVEMTARSAERLILAEGGKRIEENGKIVYEIPIQSPALLEPMVPEPKEEQAAVEEAVDLEARRHLEGPAGVAQAFAAIRLSLRGAASDPKTAPAIRDVLARTIEADEVLAPLAKKALDAGRP